MWIVVITEPEEEDTYFRTFSTLKLAEQYANASMNELLSEAQDVGSDVGDIEPIYVAKVAFTLKGEMKYNIIKNEIKE